jgi:hypothetical protein
VESLLGPALEPALRLWVIMFPAGIASAGRRGLPAGAPPGWVSVGVGGVFTISGVNGGSPGGVRGGALNGSSLWPRDRRRVPGSTVGLSSGSPGGAASELFFDLKTSRSRLLDEERFGRGSRGPRLVRLRSSAGADSRLRLSGGSSGAVVDRVSESGSCTTCTLGGNVVGLVEMAVGLLLVLASGSDVSCCDKPGPAPRATQRNDMQRRRIRGARDLMERPSRSG